MAQEMPREKLSRLGAQALKDEELLSVLLRTGYAGKNVFELSKEILKKFPDGKLFLLPYKELAKIKGIGPAKAAELCCAAELAKRYLGADPFPQITKPSDVLSALQDIANRKKEVFVVVYLNGRNKIVHKEEISVGTLNASLVHPREVFEPALKHSAASIILAHNHPSGQSVPSSDDFAITKQLCDAGKIMGIEVLDHIIISANGYFSFKDNGKL